MSPVLVCCDCGLRYGSPGWADVLVPDEIWKQISPTGDEGGTLCFNCMNHRLTELGLRNVPYEIASGPFAFSIRDRKKVVGRFRAKSKTTRKTPKRKAKTA